MIYRLHRLRQSLGAGLTAARRVLCKGARAMGSRWVAAALCLALGVGLYARYATDVNLFVIKDAGRVTVHESFTRDPEQALAEAGIHISKYDYVSLPDGPIIGRASEIQIFRANTVTVAMDGETRSVTTLENTVGDVLRREGYVPSGRDILSHDPDTQLENDMEITVTRIDILTETVTQEIPFEEIRNENTTIRKDRELVTAEGENGEKTVTYSVTYRDGELVSRVPESEEIIRPAQARVVEVGVPAAPGPSEGSPGAAQKPGAGAPRPNEAKNAPRLKNLKYGRVLEVTCTAYTTENKKWKWNRMGKVARKGTIAVDPRVIPLGSKVYVQSTNGSWIYGTAVCEDTGGSIKGNKIDLFFDTRRECINFGVRKAYVYILN